MAIVKVEVADSTAKALKELPPEQLAEALTSLVWERVD